MKIFIESILLFLILLIILVIGFYLGFEERLFFKSPEIFTTLFSMSSYLAYDIYKSKKDYIHITFY